MHGDGHTSALLQVDLHCRRWRLEVCDGAHWAFVMEKGQRRRPSSEMFLPNVNHEGMISAALWNVDWLGLLFPLEQSLRGLSLKSI